MGELTISKSSRLGRYYDWIYRGLDGKFINEHWSTLNNLCQFVRRLVAMTLLKLIAYGTILATVGAASFCASYAVYFLTVGGRIMPSGNSFWAVILILGLSLWLTAIVLGAGFAIRALKNRWRRGRDETREPPRSLLREWLSAKKQKVCPLIKVVD